MRNLTKRLVSFCLLVAIVFSFPIFMSAAESETPLSTLVFASDYQYSSESPGTLLSTLRTILPLVNADNPNIDEMIFCGDYTNTSSYHYNASASSAIRQIKTRVSSAFGSSTKTLFVQGNHDSYDSSIMATDGATENNNYIVYVMNTQTSNPWRQGELNEKQKVIDASNALKAYLNGLIQNGETRPVIIATHVPLHMNPRTSKLEDSRTGDNMYSSYFFDVLNEAGNELDIVYLFGHNHASGYDSYMGGSCVYLTKGDTIAIPDCEGVETTYTNKFNLETLNFTYMNAGYIGYNAESASEDELTVSVLNIYSDRIEVTRYGLNGKFDIIGAKGAYNTEEKTGRLDDSKGYKADGEELKYYYLSPRKGNKNKGNYKPYLCSRNKAGTCF